MKRPMKSLTYTSCALALFAAVYLGCKTTGNYSGLKDNGTPPAVTDVAQLGKYLNLTKGGALNYVQLTVDKIGLLNIQITLSGNSQNSFANPVKLAVFSADDQGTALAAGDVGGQPNVSYIDGQMVVSAKKTGDYFILIDHKGQLDANSYGSMNASILSVPAGQSNIINYPGSLNYTEISDGKPINLKLVASKSLVTVNFNATLYSPSTGVMNNNANGNSCANCAASMTLTDNGKKFKVPLQYVNNRVNGQASFDLQTGTYDLDIDIENLPNGSMVQSYVNANQLQTNQGTNFTPGVPMGFLNLTFDQNNGKTAVFGGVPFGYDVTSNRVTESKIDLNFSITRIYNTATVSTPIPTKIDVDMTGPDGSNNSVGSVNLDGSGGWFNGAIMADLEKGKYKVRFDDKEVDNTDIVNINATMEVSNLSIGDGGPDFSTFKDLGTVTITPPNNYLADMNVTTQPHKPDVTPVDLASESVLQGMELIRKTFHVRIPKGSKRGPTNRIDEGTIQACLGNEAAHWSDLILHYYCQYGQARSCYTNTIRNKAQTIGGDTTLDTAQKLAKLKTIRVETYAECAATATQDAEWNWLVTNQGDVFQYVMNSQTFAFDIEQQQALINKFYRINDPTDVSECNQKRPRRAIDPTDGTHCLPTKIFPTPMKAAGR